MTRRSYMPAVLSATTVLAVGLSACGSEESVDTGSGSIEYPTSPDQAVVDLTVGGGFVPEGTDFRAPAVLTVLGDGTTIQPGAVIMIYPGPLLPPLSQAEMTPEGIETILESAEEAGLLAPPPDYEIPADEAQISDAPTTTLVLQANGETYAHSAYALGLDAGRPESTPARQNFADFVASLQNLPALVGDALGEPSEYTPERFAVMARPSTDQDAATADGIEADVVPWPDTAPPLADAEQCTEIPAGDVGDTFSDANELTLFSQAGTTYRVFVHVLLPNESCATLT